MFLHFYAFEHLIRRDQPEFSMVWSGLEKYLPRKKERVLLTDFRKLGVFKWNMASPWINTYQTWNAFQAPYISHNEEIQTIFADCSVTSDFVNFWNFQCRKRSKKGLLQLWLLRALKTFFENFQKLMWFIWLLSTRDSLKCKFWSKIWNRGLEPPLCLLKGVSTRAPGSGSTCYHTDFIETLPVWRVYPKLKKTKWFLFWFFPGGDRPPPSFLGFHQGNRLKIGKLYEALTAMVFNQLLWQFAHILQYP